MASRIASMASILCIVVAILGSAVAQADYDRKTYPATICQQAGRRQSLDYYHGRVINRSAGGVVTDCPVVTDSPHGVLYKGHALVSVLDRSYYDDISCTLFQYDERSPTPRYAFSSRRTSGWDGRVQVMVFDHRSSANAIAWYADSPSILGCYVPGVSGGWSSEILSYRLFEYEDGLYDSSM